MKKNVNETRYLINRMNFSVKHILNNLTNNVHQIQIKPIQTTVFPHIEKHYSIQRILEPFKRIVTSVESKTTIQ